MADMESLTSLKDLSTCGICFELFNEDIRCPRILPCGHTFCHSCLEEILFQSPSCPTCKADIEFQRADLIPTNYFARDLICIANPAVTPNEDIPNRPADSVTSKLESEGFCSEHSSDKQIRCMDCEVWICGTCGLLHHRQCRTLLAREAYRELKGRLSIKAGKELKARKSILKNVEKSLINFEEERNNLMEEMRNYEIKLERCNKKISNINSLKVESSEFSKNLRQVQTEVETSKNDAEISKLLNKFDDLSKQRKNWMTQLENLKLYPTTVEDLKNLSQERREVYVVDDENEPLYGKVTLIDEQIRISSLSPVKPVGLHIPLKEFLQNSCGSSDLPNMIFMKVIREGNINQETKEVDVVIRADGTSPIVKNFVLLCSGLKRHSYKGMLLNNKESLLQLNSDIPSVAELTKDFIGKYPINSRIHEGSVYVHGVNSSRFSISLQSSIRYCFQIGVVISGLEEIKRLKNCSKFTVGDCGLVIDKRSGFKRLMQIQMFEILKIHKTIFLYLFYNISIKQLIIVFGICLLCLIIRVLLHFS